MLFWSKIQTGLMSLSPPSQPNAAAIKLKVPTQNRLSWEYVKLRWRLRKERMLDSGPNRSSAAFIPTTAQRAEEVACASA